MPFCCWFIYGESPRPDSKAQFAQKVKLFFAGNSPRLAKIARYTQTSSRQRKQNSALVIYPQRKVGVANLSMCHKQNLPVGCRPAQRTICTVGNITRLFWTDKRLACLWLGSLGAIS